jgi:hypothetical protein
LIRRIPIDTIRIGTVLKILAGFPMRQREDVLLQLVSESEGEELRELLLVMNLSCPLEPPGVIEIAEVDLHTLFKRT